MRAMTIRTSALVLATLTTLAACADRPAPAAPDLAAPPVASLAAGAAASDAPAPSTAQAKYEIDFMTDMIDHHQMAIMMAELCLQKAVHEELRTLCQNIIATQREEITRMQTWLRSWYGITYQPEMKPGDRRMMEKMAALSGAEFEIEFMEMMIKHHSKAVREGEQCLRKAYHRELRELCGDIVETQTEEIALMESWLCAWYDICR